ncbi:MAG: aromatic amino acid transport family protein [Chlamydiota bacterium]
MHLVKSFGHLFGGTLLVAGTSIGVGMLALPVATAKGGFIPSLFLYVICWLFMLCTGLLILEASIWMPKDANLITMSRRLLGKGGQAFCWTMYLFLFSCLMVAHVAGGGNAIAQLSNGSFPHWINTLIYVIIFSPVVYLGTKWVDRLNLLLMLSVAVTYLMFVFISVPHIDARLLGHINWFEASWALPVVFTAFGYQGLIPTLVTYMNRNIQKVRLAIILGTSIPLIMYIVWELIILGIVPIDGPQGLIETRLKGQNAVYPLQFFINKPWLTTSGQIFALFAMTTSYVGISIAFVDFLADGLKVKKTGLKKLGLCALVFVTPTVITLFNPNIFINALTYAGGFGVALLLGAMPIAMVWSGRYFHGYSGNHRQLPGGKALLACLMAFIALELCIELF